MNMPKMLLQLCFAASILTSAAMAQDHPIPTPTAEHKILAADEGTWDATIKTYQNGPESEPAVSKGLEINTVITGGLWISSVFKGDFGGMAFEGAASSGTIPRRRRTSGPGSIR